MKIRTLVWFSCGAASAVAAKMAINRFGDQIDLRILYCNLLADEHPDNARFLRDVERWIGRRIVLLQSAKYQTVADVQLGKRFIRGMHGAPCTDQLKVQVRIAYQQPGDVHVLGFTSDEPHRIAQFEKRHPDVECEWLLRDAGITKAECYRIIAKAGIELPAMYRLGYHNNNCMGCVKGGMGYWNKIRGDFPERFAAQAQRERLIGHAILRRNGKPLYLDELPADAGRHDDLDIGDCDSFTCAAHKQEAA